MTTFTIVYWFRNRYGNWVRDMVVTAADNASAFKAVRDYCAANDRHFQSAEIVETSR